MVIAGTGSENLGQLPLQALKLSIASRKKPYNNFFIFIKINF